ncbi:hypothetical protein OBBRIDRAFT_724788 [Obba rivulosa]|uniref:YCII-related domain-containing protein n=1 Tax=Obba rivulosa TaxID=1052685 RepID=A0A8E2DPP0_9APHY|nr:hypothetical protein OBBRIDRAFT_724788 [Obba rivulosa]
MSSTASPGTTLYKFLVYAPDKADPSAAHHRQALQAEHMKVNEPKLKSGYFNVAGLLLSEPSLGIPENKQTLAGSFMIVEAENIDSVKEHLKKDPYYTSGKWDTDRVAIHPFYWALGQQ